jgi:hypothetical protein
MFRAAEEGGRWAAPSPCFLQAGVGAGWGKETPRESTGTAPAAGAGRAIRQEGKAEKPNELIRFMFAYVELV